VEEAMSELVDPSTWITDAEETRKGFLEALQIKQELAEEYLKKADELRTTINNHPGGFAGLLKSASPKEKALWSQLISLAGISEKARKNLESKKKGDKQQPAVSLETLVRERLDKLTQLSTEELVGHFLLVCGHALGGKYRNRVGKEAQRRFVSCFLDALEPTIIKQIKPAKSRPWAECPKNGPPEDARGFAWEVGEKRRVLLLNEQLQMGKKKNSVDICLFDGTPTTFDKKGPLALGELKGGFDPAGADEHWKTAQTALKRINDNYPTVPLFFAGAAIVKSTATYLGGRVESKKLHRVANLTKSAQLLELCRWLCSL
jgi:Restriction endonuclease BsobI